MNADEAREQAEQAFRDAAPKPPTLAEVRVLADMCGKTGSDEAKKAVMLAWRLLDDDDRAVSGRSIATLLGVRVDDLRGKAAKEDRDDSDDLNQADELIDLAGGDTFFIDARDAVAYADVEETDRRETHRVVSKGYKDVLRARYLAKSMKSVRNEAVAQAVATLEARAIFSPQSEPRDVFLRSAMVGNNVYLDTGSSTWDAIELDASGWRFVDRCEVRFRRTKETRPIATPKPGGDVGKLLPLLNVKSKDDFILTVAFMLQCLRGRPKFAHPVLRGEQGSGKSEYTKMVRSVVDPASSELRSPPRNEDDLFVAAQSSYLLAFDNLTSVAPWLSDSFCRMGDGGTFGKRSHYENDQETILRGGRPMIFNGISEAITASDLADRGLFINLEPIPEEKRLDDEVLAEMQDAARGEILGGLLDAVARGLKNLPTTTVPRMPRMASFARWVVACEPALVGTQVGTDEGGNPVRWALGDFMRAYRANRAGAAEAVLGADIVAGELRDWLPATPGWQEKPRGWSGTPTALFQELGAHATIRAGGPGKSKGWPTSAVALTNAIRRMAPALRGVGIDFRETRTGRARNITLTEMVPTPPNDSASKARNGSSQSSPRHQAEAPRTDDGDDCDDLKRSLDARVPGEVAAPRRVEV